MKDKKDNIDILTDCLTDTPETNTDRLTPLHKALREIVRRMDAASELTGMAEEMRESILLDIHRRIATATRRTLWAKVAAVAASVAILLGTTAYLSYQQGFRQSNSQTIEMTNPLGMQSTIVLSDGTKVYLNAGTTLKYPARFVAKNREVEVSGEAFFEVSPDATHPFIVTAENMAVRVLGTTFNIKAYREEENIEVTLETGNVEVSFGNRKTVEYLIAGQQTVFNKHTQMFRKQHVNLDYYITWKEGKFYFNSATFGSIARQLERRFNVQIHIASETLKQTVFTGDFVRNENLEQILRVMKADKRIRYTIDGDQINIY
jgi:ferric-dicitrate binding protein FerR (iron transport regulator)